MSTSRVIQSCRLAVVLISAATIAGCGGSSIATPAPGPGSGAVLHWYMDIANDTNKNDPDHPKGEYVWYTKYASSVKNGSGNPIWDIDGAGCLAPGQAVGQEVRFDSSDGSFFAVKIRAEVKAYGATDCSARTISDFYGPVCSSNFRNAAGELFVLHRRRDGQMELIEIP